MDKSNILSMIKAIENMLNFFYNQEQNKFLLNISWFNNNTNIIIRKQFESKNIIDINIEGKIEVYGFIAKSLTDILSVNNDTFSCLTTIGTNNSRRIQSQNIRTKNIEADICIYTNSGLINAEKASSIMLNKLNNINKNDKQKVYVK